MTNNTAILKAAFTAWSAASALRKRRLRNKRFTYGDQWSDPAVDADGTATTEEAIIYKKYGTAPITNNMLRQMVKTIVGRFRAEHLSRTREPSAMKNIAESNALDELDSRALEEFLISGCCIQRVEETENLGKKETVVSNVNLSHFFINHTIDPLSGYPVQHSLLSATIVAADCMTADACATVCMVMGLDSSLNFCRQHGLEGYFIYAEGDNFKEIWTEKFPIKQ